MQRNLNLVSIVETKKVDKLFVHLLSNNKRTATRVNLPKYKYIFIENGKLIKELNSYAKIKVDNPLDGVIIPLTEYKNLFSSIKTATDFNKELEDCVFGTSFSGSGSGSYSGYPYGSGNGYRHGYFPSQGITVSPTVDNKKSSGNTKTDDKDSNKKPTPSVFETKTVRPYTAKLSDSQLGNLIENIPIGLDFESLELLQNSTQSTGKKFAIREKVEGLDLIVHRNSKENTFLYIFDNAICIPSGHNFVFLDHNVRHIEGLNIDGFVKDNYFKVLPSAEHLTFKFVIIGPEIKDNRYKVSNHIAFLVDVFNGLKNEFLSVDEMSKFNFTNSVKMQPVLINNMNLKDQFSEVNIELIKKSQINSEVAPVGIEITLQQMAHRSAEFFGRGKFNLMFEKDKCKL